MNSVFIVQVIDDEYGHRDFRGVRLTRESALILAKSLRESEYLQIYNSMEEFDEKNGATGIVITEEVLE